MGRQNVALVCTYWADLPDRAFRVLVLIANMCRDGDPGARYYGGRERLTHVLGADDDAAGHRRVARAISDLVEAGALVVAKRGGNGRRAEYALALESRVGGHQVSPNSTELGDSSDTLRVSPTDELGDTCDELGDTYCHPKATTPKKPTRKSKAGLASTSPAAGRGWDDGEYSAASAALMKLPDLGASLIGQAPEELATLAERVIWAAAQMEAKPA